MPRRDPPRRAGATRGRPTSLATVGISLAFCALTALPAPAAVSNPSVRIEQVLGGVNGDSAVQFVEMKLSGPGDNLWAHQPGDPVQASRAILTFHDATGAQVRDFEFATDPPAGLPDPDNAGLSVLIATQEFAGLTGLAPDYLIPPSLIGVDGMVCFRGNPVNPLRIDVDLCLSYGNYQGTGATDVCGNPQGGPAPGLLIAALAPKSLNRFQNDGPSEAFRCPHSNADFSLQAPEPRNSAGDTAVLATASVVEQGRNLFNRETFHGNGRTCATCHRPADEFGLTPATIAERFTADPLDPLFIAENEPALASLENPCLMRIGNNRGLILENIDGFANDPVFRNAPHLRNIALTAPYGLSAGVADLRSFSIGAVQQHLPRTLARNSDPQAGPLDFRLPAPFELEAMEAFMNSLRFPPEGSLELDRMIAFAIANGADAPAIQRGRELFFGDVGQAQCFRCHSGPALSDADGSLGTGTGNQSFENGVVDLPVNDDDGCIGGPGDPTLPLPPEAGGLRKFNTPPLLGVARTGPFFHDSSAASLRDAVEFYRSDEFPASQVGQLMEILGVRIDISEAEADDITQFLQAVSVDPGPEPPQLISGKRLVVRDKDGHPNQRRIVLVSRDPAVAAPEGGTGDDPRIQGAVLRIANPSTGKEVTFNLPPGPNWKALGRNPEGKTGYRYRDNTSANGPCKIVAVRPGKVLRAVCRAKSQEIPFPLSDSPQGSLTATLQIGLGRTHCMSFGGVILKDSPAQNGKFGLFIAKDAPAPSSCPLP